MANKRATPKANEPDELAEAKRIAARMLATPPTPKKAPPKSPVRPVKKPVRKS